MELRRLLSLIALVLVLVAGSIGMATARNHPGAAGMVELCTTYGTQTVLIDAEGNPVAPSHPCPHCTPAMAALTDLAAPLATAPRLLRPLRWVAPAQAPVAALAPLPFRSRAPPVAV